MTTPDPQPSQPQHIAPQTSAVRPPAGMPNAYRVALLAVAMFVVTIVAAFLPLSDSDGNGCGSAFSPGPDSIIDSQTTECAFRVSTQQGFVYPLMIVAGIVAVGGALWKTP